MKKFILYTFLFFFLPVIPLILFIILLYKYLIIYLWLLLDIIFKDILRFNNYYVYDKIQKLFKYFFFDLFFEVLPLRLLKYLNNFNPKYIFYKLIELILKIQFLFLRLIIFLISGLPIIFKRFKYILFSFLKYSKILLKRIKIYIFFYKYKLKKVLFTLFYIFLDFLVLLKFFFIYLYWFFLSFIKYFFFFDKMFLIILNLFNLKKNVYVINNIYKNNYFYIKLLIFFNKLISLNKNIISFLFNDINLFFYMFFNNLKLIEIKNILLFNKYIKSNKIKFKFLKLLKKKFCFNEYIIVYWILNKLFIKQNYLIYLFLNINIIFTSFSKLIKYYIKKFIR